MTRVPRRNAKQLAKDMSKEEGDYICRMVRLVLEKIVWNS